MENKNIKKSTTQQLQMLVNFMEENPDLARGTPVFGANKNSTEEKWISITEKLNSNGPPKRSIVEWKKVNKEVYQTWADLKSRTKKKISENKKNLQETGGGLYRFNYLSELEQVIDRTLLLSSAAAPCGKVFGGGFGSLTPKSTEEIFNKLPLTPPRTEKVVAVITPSRIKEKTVENGRGGSEPTAKLPPHFQKQHTNPNTEKRIRRSNGEDDDQPCSSNKRPKTKADEQLALIRRQLRVAEQNAETSRKQADVAVRLADATARQTFAAESQAESLKRIADAAEAQATCIKMLLEATQRIEQNIENYYMV